MSGMTSPLSNQQFLVDTVGITQDFLSDIVQNINSFNNNSLRHQSYWNQKVTKLTTDISLFVELTTLLTKKALLNKGPSLYDFKEAHINLLFIIKAMNLAHSKSDFIGLEDLIKYELKDNLTQWKIDLIPQIKKHLLT
jgi:hypothetical protein